VDRAAHSHDAVSVRHQGRSHRLGETRVQHDEPDLRAHGGERLHERIGRHHVPTTTCAVEDHAAGLVPGGRRDGDDIAPLPDPLSRLAGCGVR
jgi:hypothetical protein